MKEVETLNLDLKLNVLNKESQEFQVKDELTRYKLASNIDFSIYTEVQLCSPTNTFIVALGIEENDLLNQKL